MKTCTLISVVVALFLAACSCANFSLNAVAQEEDTSRGSDSPSRDTLATSDVIRFSMSIYDASLRECRWAIGKEYLSFANIYLDESFDKFIGDSVLMLAKVKFDSQGNINVDAKYIWINNSGIVVYAVEDGILLFGNSEVNVSSLESYVTELIKNNAIIENSWPSTDNCWSMNLYAAYWFYPTE